MKHVTSMSKARPKQALALPDLSGVKAFPGMLGSMANSIFKSPSEKAAANKSFSLPSKTPPA